MLDRAALVKRKLDAVITQMCQVSWMFSKQPEKDFSRTKKMPFAKVLSFLLAMEGGTRLFDLTLKIVLFWLFGRDGICLRLCSAAEQACAGGIACAI